MINASTLRFPILVLSLLLLPFLSVGASEISSSIHNTLPGALHSNGSTAVQSPMSGTYYIDNTGGDYTTLGAAVTDLNLRGISGAVIFNIAAGQSFTEPSGVSITVTGTFSNTITFQKDGIGANPIFNFTGTSSLTDYCIQLFGSDFITFNGIEIRDVGTTSADTTEIGFYFLAASASDGCQNNIVKNCTIDLSKASTSSKGVYLASTSANAVTGTNSTNYFYNNTVRDAHSAYYLQGASTSAYYNDGNKIGTIDGGSSLIDDIGGGTRSNPLWVANEKNFEFYGTTVSNVTGTSGLIVYNAGGSSSTHSIYNNTFTSISVTGGGQATVLYLRAGTLFNVYGNTISNFTAADYEISAIHINSGVANVYNNKIHNISYTGSGYFVAGIYAYSGTTANIYNNLIYDIKAPNSASSTTPSARGISVYRCTNVNLYYNTVYLDYTSLSATNMSAALYARKDGTLNLLMKNNTFTNMVNVSTGSRAVAFYNHTTATDIIVAGTDNNHYYAGEASSKNLIYYNNTNSDQTIAAYKTRMATKDQHAVSGNPLFEGANFKPYNSSPLASAATPIAEVATDFEGINRSPSTPTIGAFESVIFQSVDVPYFQNFDQRIAPDIPFGWMVENSNGDALTYQTINSSSRSAPNAMHIWYNLTMAMDDWVFTPGFNLTAGIQYQVLFYYMAGGAAYPEKLEVKYGASRNSGGMTSTAIFSNTNITNESYVLGSGTFTPASTGVYFIGFHGFSDADRYYLQFDDVDIRVAPSATNSATIPANNTDLTHFGATGATIQFTIGNGEDLNLTIDKIPANPNGTPPGALLKIAPQYWVVTLTSGVVGVGRYSLTLDITGIPGVTDPTTLHLIKRANAASAWTDMGVPNAVNGNLLTWTGLDSFSEFSIGGLSDNPLPVQLSAFNVTTEARNALLNWETSTEENAFKFVVEKKNTESATWSVAGEVKASGNSSSPKKYNYTDQKLNSGKYSYRLKMIDNDGTFTYSDVVEVDISVPKDYAVSQNYPNPFNPTTKIDYQLPFDSRVQIELYNITGERVATLVNMDQKAGYYTFDFTNTSHLSSGVYIYRIIATGASQSAPYTAVKKMLLMK